MAVDKVLKSLVLPPVVLWFGFRFKLGDRVKWWSQAGGHSKTKQGEIVQVVPAGERPDRDRFPDLYKWAGAGFGRDHESYVVAVPTGKNGTGKPKHYWPRVSALRVANETGGAI